eukprot:5243176-Amphidinium_carterae.1
METLHSRRILPRESGLLSRNTWNSLARRRQGVWPWLSHFPLLGRARTPRPRRPFRLKFLP